MNLNYWKKCREKKNQYGYIYTIKTTNTQNQRQTNEQQQNQIA